MSFDGDQYAGTDEGLDLTTKGQLHTHDASANAALNIGSDTFLLTADSTETTGIKWAAPASSGLWEELADETITGSPAQLTCTWSGSYTQLQVWCLSANNTSSPTAFTFNNDAGANYKANQFVDGVYYSNAASGEVPIWGQGNSQNITYILLNVFNPASGEAAYTWQGCNLNTAGANLPFSTSGWGKYYEGTQITEIDKSNFGNVNMIQKVGGRMRVFGVAG